MKKTITILAILISNYGFSGGWTTCSESTGNVEFVEVVRSQGFLVKGKFGDPAECGMPDYIWVEIDHPQYDVLYSTALAAFMSGKKLQAYVHECNEIGWHGGSFNTLNEAGSLYLKN